VVPGRCRLAAELAGTEDKIIKDKDDGGSDDRPPQAFLMIPILTSTS
jgi:hypothetical protein